MFMTLEIFSARLPLEHNNTIMLEVVRMVKEGAINLDKRPDPGILINFIIVSLI